MHPLLHVTAGHNWAINMHLYGIHFGPCVVMCWKCGQNVQVLIWKQTLGCCGSACDVEPWKLPPPKRWLHLCDHGHVKPLVQQVSPSLVTHKETMIIILYLYNCKNIFSLNVVSKTVAFIYIFWPKKTAKIYWLKLKIIHKTKRYLSNTEDMSSMSLMITLTLPTLIWCLCGESDDFIHPLQYFSLYSTAGEAMQWDDWSREGVCQRQQTLCQRHPGPVSAVQEGWDDLGEVLMSRESFPSHLT